VTVVMVTHDLLAARRADRIIRIRDGKLAPETLAAQPVSPEGAVRLPGLAVDALYGSDLEIDVTAGEVRIRRAEARRQGRLGPDEPDVQSAGEDEAEAVRADRGAARPPAEQDPYAEFRRPT
jgi:hypothetical protein